MQIYQGEVLSEGIAVGKVHRVFKEYHHKKTMTVEEEKDIFLKAIANSSAEIEELIKQNSDDKNYLMMQKLLIEDVVLKKSVFKRIEQGSDAITAVHLTLEESIQDILHAKNRYLKERNFDLIDVKQRILDNITGVKKENMQTKFILVAKELYPSYLIHYKNKILGIVTNNGGYSSHGAILARQLHIPYMIAKIGTSEEENLIVDTRKQQIISQPSEELVQKYSTIIEKLNEEEYHAVDHQGYGFYANVFDNSELKRVLDYGFDGVGLYRTEMIFMNEDHPYSFEEQKQIYLEAVEMLKDKPICFRTFDVGSDKIISYVKSFKKTIDNYKNNKDIFETQIKALLAANIYNNIKIMFPKITSLDEFNYLKAWVLRIQKEMNDASNIKIGMMLETKEALMHVTDFKDVDFISIGTNDLVIEIYHVKRNEQKNKLQKYINDLMKKICFVVNFCKENNIELSVCGELAAITPALERLLNDGIKNFSVATPAIRILNYEITKI